MSKELKKFEGEFKKIKPKLKTHNKDTAARLKKLTYSIWLDCTSQGEEYLAESMVPAFKAGVKGTNLADFMKVKEFKEAYNTLKTAANNLAIEVNKAAAMQKEALGLLAATNKLDADITKDLKKRKDKSKSKTDIENMQKEVKAAATEFTAAGKAHDNLLPGAKQYPGSFTKKVQKVLKTPPAKAQSMLDATVLPQLLQDRNLTSNRNKVKKALEIVNSKCDDAMKAAETDLKSAGAPLKAAAAAFKALKEIHDQYVRAKNDNRVKKQINDSKDKASILKAIGFFEKAYVAAERKFRGTSTTIKKAA